MTTANTHEGNAEAKHQSTGTRGAHGRGWNLAPIGAEPRALRDARFYRGLHCPVCKNYLRDLENNLEAFRSRGMELIAISGDTRERAEETKREWKLDDLVLGYGYSVDSMREWGLFVSHAIKE